MEPDPDGKLDMTLAELRERYRTQAEGLRSWFKFPQDVIDKILENMHRKSMLRPKGEQPVEILLTASVPLPTSTAKSSTPDPIDKTPAIAVPTVEASTAKPSDAAAPKSRPASPRAAKLKARTKTRKPKGPPAPGSKGTLYYGDDGGFIQEWDAKNAPRRVFGLNKSITWLQAKWFLANYADAESDYMEYLAEQEDRGRRDKDGEFTPFKPRPDDNLRLTECFEEWGRARPAREMLEWMPKYIIRRFGSVYDSVEGEYLDLTSRAPLSEVVQALREAGYEVIHDPQLVAMAEGQESPETELVERAMHEMTVRVTIDGTVVEGSPYVKDEGWDIALRKLGIEQWAYFPTYPVDDPHGKKSRRMPPLVKLQRRLQAKQFRFCLAEATLPDTTKPAQPGVLVPGMTRLDALKLGRSRGFRVILWGYLGEDEKLRKKATKERLYWTRYPYDLP